MPGRVYRDRDRLVCVHPLERHVEVLRPLPDRGPVWCLQPIHILGERFDESLLLSEREVEEDVQVRQESHVRLGVAVPRAALPILWLVHLPQLVFPLVEHIEIEEDLAPPHERFVVLLPVPPIDVLLAPSSHLSHGDDVAMDENTSIEDKSNRPDGNHPTQQLVDQFALLLLCSPSEIYSVMFRSLLSFDW